jgi:hypothetical protein
MKAKSEELSHEDVLDAVQKSIDEIFNAMELEKMIGDNLLTPQEVHVIMANHLILLTASAATVFAEQYKEYYAKRFNLAQKDT